MRVEWKRGMGGTTFNLFESLRSKGKSWILQSNKLNLLRLVRMLLQLFLNVLFFFSLSVSESVHSSPLLTFTPKNKKRCRKSQTSPKTADLLSFLWFSSVLHQTPFLMQSQRGFLSVAGNELNVLTTTPLDARWNVSQPWATPYFFRFCYGNGE